MSRMWPLWKNTKEPESGTYELITIAGFEPEDKRYVLMVCRSLRGHLTEAFEWPQPNGQWVQASIEEAEADGWRHPDKEYKNEK